MTNVLSASMSLVTFISSQSSVKTNYVVANAVDGFPAGSTNLQSSATLVDVTVDSD